MSWNTWLSCIVRNNLKDGNNVYLVDLSVELADEVEYLGIALGSSGITDSRNKTENPLCKEYDGRPTPSLRVFQNGIHPCHSIRLYNSVVQTRWNTRCPLNPMGLAYDIRG